MLTFPLLAAGSTRYVYDLGHEVVKVCFWRDRDPENLDTIQMAHRMNWGCPCEREAALWQSSRSKLLLPILAHGPCWVRTPKATLPTKMDYAAIEALRIELANTLQVGDIWAGNVGYWQDKLVAIDYGG